MRKAQLISLVTYGPAALLSVPWLQRLPPGKALAGLLAIHVLRVLALFAIPARRDGFPLSKAAQTEIVCGDLIGAWRLAVARA